MEPIYRQTFHINDSGVDRYGRMKPSMVLFCAQEVAGKHSDLLGTGFDDLAAKGIFWAVIRQKVQITRLPMTGETITVETWPMPTTRVAYPRSTVAYDEAGNECFRAVSLWVLMDVNNRSMILPGKSGVEVAGTLRGSELAAPGSLVPKALTNERQRTVCFTDLDRNGHMNNTRYLDWIDDLLPSAFHEGHPAREFTVCYHNEAREGQTLHVSYDLLESGVFQVDAQRSDGDTLTRVFTAKVQF